MQHISGYTILGLPNIPVHSMAAEAAATAEHTRVPHSLALTDATAATVFTLTPQPLLPNSLLFSLKKEKNLLQDSHQ